LKTKIISLVLIIIGITTLVTSLNYANSIIKPKMEMPEIITSQISIPNVNTTKIKLPIVNNVKIEIDDSSTIKAANRCFGSALCEKDTITKIIDGDTIDTEQYRIRLALVDTPEKYESGFSAATSFTSNLCPIGSTISIDQDDGQKIDKYGRIVAKVTCSNTNLNEALLENMHANIMIQYCSISEFSSESWTKRFGC
jgi:endonuclease YncB( thermonuclease family)